MGQGKHRTNRKFSLESEPDVEHHKTQGQQHGQATLLPELCTHCGAYKFNSAQFNRHTGSLPKDFDHRHALLIGITEGQANQHVAIGAEGDHQRPLVAAFLQGFAYLLQVHRIAVGHLNQGAPGEIETPVQGAGRQSSSCHQHGQQGKAGGKAAPGHEGDHFHAAASSGSRLGRGPIDRLSTRRPP